MARQLHRSAGIIERYRAVLPVSDATPIVSLGEGSTPLVPSARLSEETRARVWLKLEGLNPTGSFKDRGMTLAVSKALEAEAEIVVCASTGNTSASAAAYAARAGLRCAVVVPAGGVAGGKLAQALIHGAEVFEIEGSFDAALRVVRDLAGDEKFALVNSVNPYRLEGQKTAALEIVEELGRPPDVHVMPVGNAGNISALFRGYRTAGTGESPRMYGIQARGAAPLVSGHTVARPETVASAIRIGDPASAAEARAAVSQSNGGFSAVSDDEILAAHRDLAAEGLFVEPASAAAVAGLRALSQAGAVAPDAVVVCVLTGHGLKDPDAARANSAGITRIRGTTPALRAALGR